MTANTKEEETKLNYDDRKKILHQKKSQITENIKDAVKDGEGKVTEEEKLISTVKQSMEVDYTEDGIRLAYDNLVKEESFMKERSAKLLEQLDKQEEMPKDIKEFAEKMKQLSKYTANEKVKAEYDSMQERLKIVSKDLKQLKDEIGTRLKF